MKKKFPLHSLSVESTVFLAVFALKIRRKTESVLLFAFTSSGVSWDNLFYRAVYYASLVCADHGVLQHKHDVAPSDETLAQVCAYSRLHLSWLVTSGWLSAHPPTQNHWLSPL